MIYNAKTMGKLLLILGVALPSLSIVLWAGLDIRWWVELETASGREFALIFIHLFPLIICGVFLLDLGEI